MKTVLVLLLLQTTFAHAQGKSVLTLTDYLQQVKTRNSQAQALVKSVESAQLRVQEPEAQLFTQFYAQYNLFDDKKQTPTPFFMGTETNGNNWRVGFRKETTFGLGADLYFNSQRALVHGVNTSVVTLPDSNDAQTVLELRQSLWRNGFGEGTRAEVAGLKAALDVELMQARFQLKNLLLQAQNTYWTVVSLTQVVQLQQSNVERARKLRDRMGRGEKLRLFDDTDAMQAEAAFQSRELELQTSLDDRATAMRMLNTLRNTSGGDEVVSESTMTFDELPIRDFVAETPSAAKGHMTREDFDMLRAQSKAALAKAQATTAQIYPQLDLVGNVASHGLDSQSSRSYELATSSRYPSWSVGIVFSVPIDFGSVLNARRGYKRAQLAANDMDADATYSEERAWQDLVQQKREAFGRYQRSMGVEKIQTELVDRERKRLSNGRATTFEALNIEQGLALAQIQRVRAQLSFLQIHNAIKTFEVMP